MCFADARYTQRQDIQLAPDASLVLMDLVNAGRSANGERWACTPVILRSGLICSASPLGSEGLILRAAATSADTLLQSDRECLGFLPSLLGDNPWTRRA